MAAVLAAAVVVIGIGAVQVSASWFSPGLMILPILAGGLLLWPRALLILYAIIAAMLGYDFAQNDERTGFGILATIVVTAIYAYLLARVRAKLGLLGMRGNQMLVELRDRIRAQSALPPLPEGWGAESVLRPAGGTPLAATAVPTCDGKTLGSRSLTFPARASTRRALLLSELRRTARVGAIVGSRPLATRICAGQIATRICYRRPCRLTCDSAAAVSSAYHPPAAQPDSGSGCGGSQPRGIVIGVVPDLRADAEHGLLRQGDALMLYTDGLVEVPGRDIDVGIDRLLGEADRVVTAGFSGGAARMMQALQEGAGATDDRGLVLIWRA